MSNGEGNKETEETASEGRTERGRRERGSWTGRDELKELKEL
jgi:hypothetical protein